MLVCLKMGIFWMMYAAKQHSLKIQYKNSDNFISLLISIAHEYRIGLQKHLMSLLHIHFIYIQKEYAFF